MSDLKFADTHNLVAFLEKPTKSEGFKEIVDFLNANPIKYALTVNPTIYCSCIKQFWDTVKAKTVNGEVQLQALVDKKKVIIIESTIRRDLQLEDAEATNQNFNFSKYIFDSMVKNVDSMVKFWMYPRFVQVFVNQQLGDMSHHKKIYVTSSHTKNIFANMKSKGKVFSRTITPLFQTMIVQAHEEMGEGSANPTDPHHTPIITQPSTSQPQKKQPRRKQRKDTEVSQPGGPTKPMADETKNVESVPTHSNDTLLSGEDSLKLNELIELCTNLQKKVLDLETTKTIQALEIDSLKRRVKKLENKQKSRTHKLRRLYKAGLSAKVISSYDEANLGDQEDASKQGRKILDIDANEDITLDSTHVKGQGSKDKGKEKMIEPEKPLKKKDQVLFDEQEAIRLQAQFDEEARVAREKEEANAVLVAQWNDIQDKVETDYELAQRLQQEEQEELTIEEKSKLFQQLLEKRRKFFAAKRAEEKRNRPPTKAQQRSIMCTYLKNMEGWKPKDLKTKSFANVQELFDKAMKRVNTFVDFRTEAGDELEQEKAKKQNIDDDQEEAEMKKLIKVVPDEEEVATDAISLATKPPSIVD
ncbi:hypothetical protein Tco_1524147 [Tanacetum coccineum]